MSVAPRLTMLLSAGFLFAGTTGCGRAGQAAGRGTSQSLPIADSETIRTIDTTFVQAWIRDDTTRVLGLFSPDAVLFPPGNQPVEGVSAIQAYWWPRDGSHTRITSFTRNLVDIAGTHQLAYARGVSHLAWVYEKDGKQAAQSSRSIDLVLMAPDSSGRWHIIRQMWTQLPP